MRNNLFKSFLTPLLPNWPNIANVQIEITRKFRIYSQLYKHVRPSLQSLETKGEISIIISVYATNDVRARSMSCNTDDLAERLLKCLEESEYYKADLNTWTDSLEELSEIEDAFEVDKRNKLRGKTILDVGTDCVKPLYIALKFEPDKIIGISEDLSTTLLHQTLNKNLNSSRRQRSIYTIAASLTKKPLEKS